MKRVWAACIMQTLAFSQKPELGYSSEEARAINLKEFEAYKQTMEKTRTRYQILREEVQEDGTVVVRVRKQYNDKTDVEEYFV